MTMEFCQTEIIREPNSRNRLNFNRFHIGFELYSSNTNKYSIIELQRPQKICNHSTRLFILQAIQLASTSGEVAGLSRARRNVLLASLALVNFFASTAFSVLGPFFPREANLKGLSVTMTGIIVGEFQLVICLCSPLVGAFTSSIGGRFVYSWGLVICSVCSILFGALEYCPPGIVFAVMCLLTRGVSAIGTSMFVVSSFSIATRLFPNRLSTVFGLLETAGGLGFMVGPVIGGALFQLGGFKLPFVSLGGFLLLVVLLSLCVMPSLVNDDPSIDGSRPKSVWTLVREPFCLATLFGMCVASSFLGFVDVSFQPFLTAKFHFSPVIVGLMLFLPALIYSISAALWGYLVDSRGAGLPIMIGGLAAFAVCLLFVYPAPFLPYDTNLPSLIAALVVVGLACSAVVVPVFNLIATESYKRGFDRSLTTYSVVSGLVNTAFAFGAFVGPTLGGVALDKFGLAWVLTGYSGLFGLATLICLIGPVRQNRGFMRRETRGVSFLVNEEGEDGRSPAIVGPVSQSADCLIDRDGRNEANNNYGSIGNTV